MLIRSLLKLFCILFLLTPKTLLSDELVPDAAQETPKSVPDWEPLNPDGGWSASLGYGFSASKRLLIRSRPGNHVNYYGTIIPTNDTEDIQAAKGWFWDLGILSPLYSWLSLELKLEFEEFQIEDKLYYQDASNNLIGGDGSNSSLRPLAAGIKLHLHSSGKDWNLPWGAGGSPWGRIGRPSIELGWMTWSNFESEQWTETELDTGRRFMGSTPTRTGGSGFPSSITSTATSSPPKAC
jgi:hypothetical protein